MKVLVCAPCAPELTGAVAVVGVFTEPDAAMPPAGVGPEVWRRLLSATRFGADDEDTLLVVPDASVSPDPLLLIALGDRRSADLATLRNAMARAMRRLAGFTRVTTNLAQVLTSVTNGADEAAAVVEGAMHGSYRYPPPARPAAGAEELLVVMSSTAAANTARRRVQDTVVVESAARWARDLINQPANVLTPAAFAAEARAVARTAGLEVVVKEREQLRREGFGGLLAVGAGSAHPPCLIELTHPGRGGQRVALVGKGITFDSGGLQVKGKHDMVDMRSDMAGAATVLATVRAAGELDCAHTVRAIAAVAENMSGSHAYRPGDVITHRGGKTSEVIDTDAEGRLVLADALAYAAESHPDALVDVATLTYDVIRALGDQLGGILGTDRDLVDTLLRQARLAGEPLWELPLWPGYRHNIRSRVADVRNDGGPYADAIHAALFLAEFTAGMPWAHLDIAGTAFVDELERDDFGSTGVGVRTLTQWLMS
jgi:leucyl aminopeptidase